MRSFWGQIYLNSMYSYIMALTLTTLMMNKLYKNVDLNLAQTQDFPKIIGSWLKSRFLIIKSWILIDTDNLCHKFLNIDWNQEFINLILNLARRVKIYVVLPWTLANPC